MTLSDSDFKRIEKFSKVIRHVAYGGNTSNSDIWPVMNQIKYEHTGTWSRSDCDACKVELFQEFENYIVEYEKRSAFI